MSTPILPLAVWASGTNQNSIPANDNSLRLEALNREIISLSTTAQPGTPADGDTYIIPASATGAQWATFTAKDIAIYRGGTWYAFAPTEGLIVNVAGSEYKFDGGAWVALTGGMTNPMTTAGDIIYGGTAGLPTRLPVSTNGFVLTLAAGIPSWAAATGGFSNPMTTAGDLILGGASGAPGRLGIGSNGQVLTVTAGAVGWAAATAGFTNPMTTTGDIIYASSGSTPARLAAGTNGFVLTLAAGVPTWAAASGGGALTGFTSTLETASPNNTVNASALLATGGTTNQDAVFGAKGSGAIQTRVADGSSSAQGNKRGLYAVDWQSTRSSNFNVASGNYAVIAGGADNRASANYSGVLSGNAGLALGLNSVVLGGDGSRTDGSSSAAFGLTCTANGNYSLAGGRLSTATGDYAIALGFQATTRGIFSARAHSAGAFTAAGDAQVGNFILRRATTDATVGALTADGVATAAAANSMVLPNNSVYGFEAMVSAKVGTYGDRAVFKVTGAVSRGANAAATVIDGTPTVTTVAAIGGASAWVVTAVANTTLGSLEIRVQGVAATNIKWVASVKTTEVVG